MKTLISTAFLLTLENTLINLVNEGRPFENKLKEIRMYLYFMPENDYIIITRTKEEVEKLHLIIWKKFTDWKKDSFSVDTGDYNDEWHWTLKGGRLSGSSGHKSLERHIEVNPALTIVYFSQFLTL